jgi:hypothetical protein
MSSISIVENCTSQCPVTQDALTALRVPEMSMHWIEVSTAGLRPSFISDTEHEATIGEQREQLVAVWRANKQSA